MAVVAATLDRTEDAGSLVLTAAGEWLVATATELARFTGQHLIAPQTILVRAYLEQIFGGLRDAGLTVFHVVLDAGAEVLRQRIQGSAETQAWRLDHLAEYRSSRAWMIRTADLAVDTSSQTPAEIAVQIAEALPDRMRTSSPSAPSAADEDVDPRPADKRQTIRQGTRGRPQSQDEDTHPVPVH